MHLYNVGGSLRRIAKAENLLWQGDVAAAMALFADYKVKRGINFLNYLQNHYRPIPKYDYLQRQGISIASGSFELTVKQIGRRVKISDAQ